MEPVELRCGRCTVDMDEVMPAGEWRVFVCPRCAWVVFATAATTDAMGATGDVSPVYEGRRPLSNAR